MLSAPPEAARPRAQVLHRLALGRRPRVPMLDTVKESIARQDWLCLVPVEGHKGRVCSRVHEEDSIFLCHLSIGEQGSRTRFWLPAHLESGGSLRWPGQGLRRLG